MNTLIRPATILSAAVLAFLAGAPAAAAPPSVHEEVRAFVTRYIEAQNIADRDAVAAMLSRQAQVSRIEMGAIARGWELIRSVTGNFMAEAGTHRISLGAIEVTPLGPEHALVVAPMTIALAASDAGATMHGAMTLILARAEKGWTVLHDHTSLQFPIVDFGAEN